MHNYAITIVNTAQKKRAFTFKTAKALNIGGGPSGT